MLLNCARMRAPLIYGTEDGRSGVYQRPKWGLLITSSWRDPFFIQYLVDFLECVLEVHYDRHHTNRAPATVTLCGSLRRITADGYDFQVVNRRIVPEVRGDRRHLPLTRG